MAFPPQGQQPQRPPMQQQGMPQQGAPPQQPPVAPPSGMEQGMEGTGEEQFQSTIDGEELQMLLFSRVKELSEPELNVLDSIITPETVPVLFKLFPELGILFEQGSQIQEFMQQQGKGAAAGGGMPEQQQGQPMEEESDNPLVNDNLSRGLMG